MLAIIIGASLIVYSVLTVYILKSTAPKTKIIWITQMTLFVHTNRVIFSVYRFGREGYICYLHRYVLDARYAWAF